MECERTYDCVASAKSFCFEQLEQTGDQLSSWQPISGVGAMKMCGSESIDETLYTTLQHLSHGWISVSSTPAWLQI